MAAKEGENAEGMEVEEGEEEDEEETKDFGPDFNPIYFDFLIEEKPEEFYEGDLQLNRPFRASVNFLDNPHGSVKLFQGDSCVLCAVFGPTEIRIAKELPHRAAVDVLFRPKITGMSQLSQITSWDSTIEERAVETKIAEILETVLYLEDDMGAGFNVILHEFENDGCLFSTCVNAVSLALLNAGCSMRCTFAAVTFLVKEEDDLLIIDPSLSQIEKGFDALVTYVMSNNGNILYTGLQGKTTAKLLTLCMRQAKSACDEIFRFLKQVQLSECSSYFTTNTSTVAGKNKVPKVDVKPTPTKVEKDVNVKLERMKIDNANEDDDYEDVEDSPGDEDVEEEEEGEVVDISSDSDA